MTAFGPIMNFNIPVVSALKQPVAGGPAKRARSPSGAPISGGVHARADGGSAGAAAAAARDAQ
eukprot:3750150-Rhodomonas_salina.1